MFVFVGQLQPVGRCRSGGSQLGFLDEWRGSEKGKGISEFSYYSISARETSPSLNRKTDAPIRVRQSGRFDHPLEKRVSFATVLVIHFSS